VYFLGGFGKPGALQLLRTDLTLLQALALVGGVTPAADADHGFVLRKDQVIPVNFTKLTQKGDLTQDVKLEPGDSVVAPLADLIYLQGEVKAPGAVKYTQDLTVVRAIAQGGGLTPMSAGGRVDILRGKGEKKERIRVDVDKMMRAPDENLDVMLKPDDIIFVPQRLF
jgi:polysaccharide export outer membrane protein